jgi:hypothetical protein
MASRKVKTFDFNSIQFFSEADSSNEDQAFLISDLEDSVSVNRQLLYEFLKAHTASARDGPPTASRIPSGVAESMIKDNALMVCRLQRLERETEELVATSAETIGQIKKALRSETSISQAKATEYAAIEQDLKQKDLTLEQLAERAKKTEQSLLNLKKAVMPESTRESLSMLNKKNTQIKDMKHELGYKLKQTEHRRDQIWLAQQELLRHEHKFQESRCEVVSEPKPLEDIGYGQ